MSKTSNTKLQKTGIFYESIILFLIPVAQSTSILINSNYKDTYEQWRLFIFFGFALFAASFLFHLMFALIHNKKRVESLQRIARLLTFILLIVNLVENQLIRSDPATDEVALDSKTEILVFCCSAIGIYIYGVISMHTTPVEQEKKFLTCLIMIYFSLRVSIYLLNPILAILGGLLCVILVRCFYLFESFKVADPSRHVVKDMENFLLKLLLSDNEDGYAIIMNNNVISYSNSRVMELLPYGTENLFEGLKGIMNFDVLTTEEQANLKEIIFETMLAEKIKEDDDDEPPGSSTPKFKKDPTFQDPNQSPLESNFTREQTMSYSPLNKHDKSFFSMRSKNRQSHTYMSINSSKFKPVSPLLGPRSPTKKLKSLPLKSFKTNEHDSKFQSDVFSYANVGEERVQTSQMKFSITQKESSISNNASKKEFTIKHLFSKKESLYKETSPELKEEDEERNNNMIFKAGVPKNLSKLFQVMEMRNVPAINFPLTVDQIVQNMTKGIPQSKYEYNGFTQERNAQYKLMDVMLQPIILNKQPVLVVRLREKSEKEFSEYLKQSEKGRVTVLASVSHELRTPLNCIVTMLDLVEKFVTHDIKENYIHPATTSAKLLLNLINDILDFSQSRANTIRLSYTTFNLKKHLMEILKLMDIQAKGKGLDLHLYYDPRVPLKVHSDPNRVRQIVINLIGNALKFTTTGAITVKVFYSEPTVYKILVTDTGVGIKSEDLKNIFRKFSKLSETHHMNQQGVGLGLVISNMLARMLGPNDKGIGVESRYGLGTTFSFELKSKVLSSEVEDMDLSFSSEEEGVVVENMNYLKERANHVQSQLNQLRKKKYSRSSKSRMGLSQSFASDSKFEKEESLPLTNRMSPLVQPARGINRWGTPTKLGKIDLNLNQRSSFSVMSEQHERGNSFGPRQSFRTRCLFEEEEYARNMDEKDKLIKKLSSKLNTSFEEAFILIVDDNAFNIIALKSLLEGLNFRIDSATSGDLAIQKILERKEKYNDHDLNYKLVFMDCNMPFKDGYEVTREIRMFENQGAIPRIPIIAVTASSDDETVRKCLESGMDGHMTKPVNLNLIKTIIAQYMSKEIDEKQNSDEKKEVIRKTPS